MRGVFDDEELEEPKRKRDTELTLGAGTLLLVFFALVLVCGLCFGLGYAVGHRGGQGATEAGQQAMGTPQADVQGNGSLAKPSATSQPSYTPAAQSAPSSDGSQPGAAGAPAGSAVPGGASSSSNPGAALPPASNQSAGNQGQPLVHPALPPVVNASPVVSASSVHPAVPAAIPLMVQIAAVSRQEDADVLVGALRKRGYAVSAHREPADNLIHVRIGPFNSRDEAERWRMKLLNDGYNAMVQP